MDAVDRLVVGGLQNGFPLCERPYAEVALRLGLSEDELIARLARLRDDGVLSRFGPMYHAERLGGGLTLAATAVPKDRYDEVARQVNAHPEVAHNYAREHSLNMWFVLATDRPGRIARVIDAIEAETGLTVLNLPKTEEFFIGLRLEP
jgi:DNA-binding Lrp family transcriptional regulator